MNTTKVTKQRVIRSSRAITLYNIKDGDTGQQVAEGLKGNFNQIVTQMSQDETILQEHTNSIENLQQSIGKKKINVLANSGIIYDEATYNAILPQSYIEQYPFKAEYANGFPWLWLNINNPEGNEFDLQIRKDGMFLNFGGSSETVGTISEDNKTITLTTKDYIGFEVQKDLEVILTELNGLYEVLITIDEELYRYYFYVNNFFEGDMSYNLIATGSNNYELTVSAEKEVFKINNGPEILYGGEIGGSTTGSVTVSDIKEITTPIEFNEVTLGKLINNISSAGRVNILSLEGTGTISNYAGSGYSVIKSGQELICTGSKLVTVTDVSSKLYKLQLSSLGLSGDYVYDIANGDRVCIGTIDSNYNQIKIELADSSPVIVTVNGSALTGESDIYTYNITGEEESFDIAIEENTPKNLIAEGSNNYIIKKVVGEEEDTLSYQVNGEGPEYAFTGVIEGSTTGTITVEGWNNLLSQSNEKATITLNNATIGTLNLNSSDTFNQPYWEIAGTGTITNYEGNNIAVLKSDSTITAPTKSIVFNPSEGVESAYLAEDGVGEDMRYAISNNQKLLVPQTITTDMGVGMATAEGYNQVVFNGVTYTNGTSPFIGGTLWVSIQTAAPTLENLTFDISTGLTT